MKVKMRYKINNIYNEDSYIAIKHFPDNSIDAIYTDIPYLIIGEEPGKGSSIAKRIRKVYNDYINEIKDGIDYAIFDDMKRIMKKVNIFIWCSKMQVPDILNYWLQFENINFEILTWVKTNPTPATNNVWLPDIEYCLYFREKGVRLNDGYENKSKWFMSGLNVDDKKDYGHPTIKPLQFVKQHILHTTQPNDLVVDFFLGSGTTAVACKENGRNFIGFEISEDYFKIAKNRLKGINKHGQMSLFYINEDENND